MLALHKKNVWRIQTVELSELLKALVEHNKTGNGYQIQLNSGNLDDKSARFTLLKDNPSGNCRKWHIPHSSCI